MIMSVFSNRAVAGRTCSMVLLALVCILMCSPAHAAEFSVFGGTEMDGRGQGYTYAAIDGTQKINGNFSVSGRVMPSYLTYKYFSGGNLIKAESPGVSGLVGIKTYFGRVSFSLFGGLEVRNTNLHPSDPYASVKGHTAAGVIQGELDAWITKTTNFWLFGSYSGTSNYSYEKARIKQQVYGGSGRYRVYVGAEQFYGRNVDFHVNGYGPMVELVYMPQKLSLAAIGGYKRDSTFGDGAYWGFQVYKGF